MIARSLFLLTKCFVVWIWVDYVKLILWFLNFRLLARILLIEFWYIYLIIQLKVPVSMRESTMKMITNNQILFNKLISRAVADDAYVQGKWIMISLRIHIFNLANRNKTRIVSRWTRLRSFVNRPSLAIDFWPTYP